MKQLTNDDLSARAVLATQGSATAKGLDKAALARRDDLVDALNKAAEEVSLAYADYSNALEAYNDRLAEAREWRDSIVTDMELYVSERSERWQQGDAGSAYQEWQGEYENLDLEDVEVPDELQLEHEDLVGNLPDQP